MSNDAVHSFVGRLMAGFNRAGINNDQVAKTKLSNRVLPLEAWSIQNAATAATSSSSSSSSSSAISFQSAIKRDKEFNQQDVDVYVQIPIIKSVKTSKSTRKRRRNNRNFNTITYENALNILHQTWLRYYQQAVLNLNEVRLRKIVGLTLNLNGAMVEVVSMKRKEWNGRKRKKRKVKERDGKEEIVDDEEVVEEEKVMGGVGILLNESVEVYEILMKGTGKVVRVKKKGTVLRVLVNRESWEVCRS